MLNQFDLFYKSKAKSIDSTSLVADYSVAGTITKNLAVRKLNARKLQRKFILYK